MQKGVLWCSLSISAVEAHLLGVQLLVQVAVVELGAEPRVVAPLLKPRSVIGLPVAPKYPEPGSW